MKQKEELLREAEEEIDAQDREYLSQGAQVKLHPARLKA